MAAKPRPKGSKAAEALFARVATDAIHGCRSYFDTLTPHEQREVIKWLTDAIVRDGSDGRTPMYDIYWEVDYVRRPVSIEAFVDDREYLGRFTAGLHDRWKAELSDVFRPGSGIYKWFLGGAIGVGKTTVAVVALLYQVYRLTCMRDPARYYGLLPGSRVAFGIYSATKEAVGLTGYAKLQTMLGGSPYFLAHAPRSPKRSFVDLRGCGVVIVPGSRAIHALGQDLYSLLIDEASFMGERRSVEGDPVGQAYELSNATESRIRSRFTRPGGVVPGLMLYVSSKRDRTAFWERKVAAADPAVSRVTEFRLWDVKPSYLFKGRKFRVQIGDRVTPSRILADKERKKPGAKIIPVPSEYRDAFEEDVDRALRDIAGVATHGITPLIYDRQSVVDARREHLRHPFTVESISLSTMRDTLLEDVFQVDALCKIKGGKWVPRYHPTALRYIHVDPSRTMDCLGMAMVHVGGLKEIERGHPDGTLSQSESPYIVVDFMLRVWPPDVGEIDFSKIRSFIVYLAGLFPLAMVTMDSFQSADSLQIIRKQNIESKLLSVDRTPEPYLMLRSTLSERRLATYRYAPWESEVVDLERSPATGKVDHPTTGSDGSRGRKDVADAVAGAVYACVTDKRSVSHVGTPVGGADPAPDRRRGAGTMRGRAPRRETPRVGAPQWDSLRDQARMMSRG